MNDGTPYSAFEDFLRARLYEGSLDFDGLFCATDLLAHRTRPSVNQTELRAPEDVQIIGCDGTRSFGDQE